VPDQRPVRLPTWATRRQALQAVCYRRNLRSAVVIVLIVGTVLFAINQLDVVVHGGASTTVVVKIALTYLVPFCVSNYGVLVATRRRRSMPPVATRRDRVR